MILLAIFRDLLFCRFLTFFNSIEVFLTELKNIVCVVILVQTSDYAI